MPVTPDPGTALETLAILAELTVKGAVVLGVAGLLTWIIRRAPASDRHAVWFVALAGIVLLPAAAALLPEWKAVDAPAWMQYEQSERIAAPTSTFENVMPGQPGAVPRATDYPMPGVAPASTPDASSDAAANVPGPAGPETFVSDKTPENPVVGWLGQIISGVAAVHWSVLLFWTWIAGAGLIMLNLILGAMQLVRISGRSRPVQGTEWRDLADEIGDRLFITRDVLILKGASTGMPMTWGGLRPVVLLPADADTWSSDRKRCVLTHEFAHIKRWDTTTQGIAQIACAVFWFNPLVWFAAGRLRSEREKACDERVLALGTQPSDYADHLLDLARTVEQSALHPLGAVAMAKPTQLEGRVLSILRNRPTGFRAGRTIRTMAAIAAVLTFFPLAALSPATPDSDTVPQHVQKATPDADPVSTSDTASDVRQERDLDVDTRPDATTAIHTPSPVHATPADTIDVPRERLAAVFMEALRDSDPDIRQNAARMLGDLEVEAAVEALGETLEGDTNDDVRRSAAWALGEIGASAGGAYLLVGLDDASPEIRRAVVHALEDLDYVMAVPELRSRVSRESNPDVRSAMVWALGEFEDPASVDVLIDALRDANDDVRSMAVWALGELEDERAVDALTELMQDENPDIRRRVIWALQEIESPRSLDTFMAATRDEDPEIRRHAVLGLNELEDSRSVERLIELLGDPNEEVRAMAAHTLGDIEDDRAAAPLADLLNDESSKVRRAAIHALSEFESPVSRDALIGATKADDAEIRLAAVTALREFEDFESVRALETALTRDSDAEVRKRAARMLMHMDTDEALDALDRALEAGGDVREAVMQALGRR